MQLEVNNTHSYLTVAMYGRGVYSAKNFSYSARDEFSKPDECGLKYVIQCSVLTGEFAVGNSSLLAPLELPSGKRYDSAVDDVTDPSIFVVFTDFRMYPRYVITFVSPPDDAL
jgi:Poly(ADP-ribose) polymerase catalytic domain